jgi:hypothetical protein
MAEFDMDAYLRRRPFNPNGTDKLQALEEATQSKIKALSQYSAERQAQKVVADASLKESVVGMAGLDPDGVAGTAVNTAVRLGSAFSKASGMVGSGVWDLIGAAENTNVPDDVKQARANELAGKATQADLDLLARPVGKLTEGYKPKAGHITNRERVQQMEESFKNAQGVREFFDLSNRVYQGDTQQLQADITDASREDVSKVRDGVQQLKDGSYIDGVGNVASGVAGSISNAVKAGSKNPKAVVESLIDQAPNLLSAAAGNVPGTAYNLLYGLDTFGEGVQAKVKKGNGAMPSDTELAKTAGWAAASAAAEIVGDKLMDITGVLKGAGKGAAKAGEDAVEEVARKTLKERLLGLPAAVNDSPIGRVTKATAKGGAGEYLTEGAQTATEAAAKGQDATLEDVNLGASLGLLTGAPMSGGVHALQEVGKAAAGITEKKADKAQAKLDHTKAIETNDVSGYLDPKSSSHDPVKAAQVLFGHAQLETTSEETKQANLEQASKIVSDLEAQRQETYDMTPEGIAEAQAHIDGWTPEQKAQNQAYVDMVAQEAENVASLKPAEIEQLNTELSRLDRQIEDVRSVKDGLTQLVQPKPEDMDSHVTAADLSVDPQDQAALAQVKQSANTVINLSMAHPNALSHEAASKLANNMSNGLSEGQRSYLRSFSEARQAENRLKTMGDVGKEILQGDPAKNQLGIAQYRTRVAEALQAGNQKEADRNLAMLAKFVKNHADKSRIAIRAMQEATKTGKAIQIVPTKQGWEVAAAPFTDEDLRKAQGLTIHKGSGKLIGKIQEGFKALHHAQAELRHAYTLRFAPDNQQAQSTGKNQETVADSSSTQSTQSTAVDTVDSNHSTVDSSVDSSASSTTAEKPSVQDQVNDEQSSPIQKEVDTSSNEGDEFNGDERTGDQQSTESTADNSAAVEDGKLANFSKEPTVGKSYHEQDLIRDYFIQSAGTENGAQRPLVKVKNFLSQLAEGSVSLKDFLLNPESANGDAQITAFTKFKEEAARWFPMIQANLIAGNRRKDDPKFYFKDMVQFLIQKEGKQLDLEENTKTAIAIAAFSWIAENATRSAANSDEEINLILGRDEGHLVTDQERNSLAYAGTRENVVINSLGQRAVQVLGLKATKDAPKDLMPRLESALGAHALKLLLDDKILVREIVSGSDMKRMTGNENTKVTAQFKFISLARDNQRNLLDKAESIYKANKGSQGFLDKLFSVEAAAKEPSFEPIPFSQKMTRNTNQQVPERLAKIVTEKNAEANYVRQDMWHLIGQLDETIALDMVGVESISPSTTHKSKRTSIQAKNDGLIREFRNFMDYVGGTVFPSENGLEQPLYFEHSVWKQQRVGIATNMINPQSSKIHRFMLFRKAWETKVSMNALDSFKLRVLEGLGVKTDKQGNTKSLDGFDAKVGTPEIKAAVAVLQKQIYEGAESLTAAEQETLLKGVKAGGEKFHSLDALVALAHFEQAKVLGKGNFTVQMMGEIDGVTNGPMLSHLLLGAASSAKELFGLLNRGGFFEEGNADSQYNIWRGKPGQTDLYETTTRHVMNNVRRMVQAKGKDAVDQRMLTAVYAFTGQLENEKTQAIEKAGRNIIKTPLTAMVFGSSVDSALNSMANKFVESVYDAMEATATNKKDALSQADLITNLRQLGISITTKDSLLEREFTEDEISRLKNVFRGTLGKAVEATMKQDFAVFMENRKTLNKVAQAAFALYDAAYQGYRQEFLDEMVQRTKDGRTDGIAIDGVGKPIRDLTQAEERDLRKKVDALFPVIHTLMSKDSNNQKAGLLSAKTDRKLSDESMYESSIQFGQAFGDNGAFSVGAHAYNRVEIDPGVAMMVMLIHSTDSAISHYAAEGNEVLNVHDAHGSGLGQFDQTARNLNKATWNAMLNYSPASEMLGMFERTAQGLDSLMSEGVPDVVKDKVASAINKLATDAKIDPKVFLSDLAVNASSVANQADKIKLEALAQMGFIDQYALEGGNYEVTNEDRAAAQTKLAQVPSGTSEALMNAVKKIEDSLGLGASSTNTVKPAVKAEAVLDTRWGGEGKPAIESDPELVALFEKRSVLTAPQAIRVLAKKLSAGKSNNIQEFNLRLLKLIEKTVNPELTIRYVTPSTANDQVLEGPSDASRGWYVSKNGQEVIYALSPEFKFSGLTDETLLHELTHGALARTIEQELEAKKANPKYTSPALRLINELESLRGKAIQFITENNLSQFKAAVTNVHELVAWGMSNLDFQKQVLNQITMTSKTQKNVLIKGMKAFIDILTGLLFRTSNKTAEEQARNGMGVLISNVSGLFHQASKANKPSVPDINLSMAAQVRNMTTLDIFESLSGNSSKFTNQMRGLLEGIVSKLHGPFGSLKESRMSNTVLSPTDLWLQSLVAGEAPFASEALASGFRFNDQEAFVLEQVEATVRAAVDDNENQSTFAYSELAKLYQEVRAAVRAQDFVTAGIAPNLQAAQSLYDFIFKMEKHQGNRSDYLARFAAVGLAHEGFNKVLDMATSRRTQIDQAKGFVERLEAYFQKVMGWIVGKVTHTYEGQAANVKLEHLVDQLIGIEAKKRAQLLHRESTLLEPLEAKGQEAVEFVRKKVGEFGRSAIFKQSKNGFVNAAGAVLSTIAQDRVDFLMEGFNRLRDQQFRKRHGVLAGLINEIRGANDSNKVFHALLRETKHQEGERKNEITAASRIVLESFANKGQDLTEKEKEAISYIFLRTDMVSLLDQHKMSGIAQLLNSPSSLAQEIRNLEAQLATYPQFQHYFTKQAKVTGYYLTSSESRGAHLMLNAGNIARLSGTPHAGSLSEQQATQVEHILEQLITLRAIEYADQDQKSVAKNVLYREMNRPDGNGVEMVLKLHRELQKQSKERLFEDADALYSKGYTPEIYNPYREVKVANLVEGEKLKKMGYVRGAAVSLDPSEKNQGEIQHLYLLRDGGLRAHTTGTMSYTGMRAKGSRARTDGAKDINDWRANQDDLTAIHRSKANAINRMFAADPNFDPRKVKENYAVPVLDAQGRAMDYRYLMQAGTKDVLLERDNRFEKILGALAGSIYDKETSTEQNRKVVEALYQQYHEEFAHRSESYVRIGPDSTDAEHREIWQLLPESTKQAVREIWGSEGMLVRIDLLDINFGYRKSSLSDVFTKEAAQRNIAEKFFADFLTHILGEKAALRVRQFEDIWQEVVKETKDILVVKTGVTLMGNVMSNLSQLLWFGVNPKDILHHHRVALKGVSDYRKDSALLADIKLKLSSGYTHGNQAELEREVIRLEDALARNPVKELIEAGLMPSIVEDVAADDDLYSYKSRFVRNTEKFTKGLNPNVLAVGRMVYMAKDTKAYQALSYGTQVSDFVARYTLYQHLTNRKKNPMDKDATIQLVSDAFVNYDIPSHRTIQYLNDMGALYFTKYYLRIQKVIAHLYRDQPGRALAILALGEYFNSPVLTDSQFIHRMNNPLQAGALKFPGSLDELATIKAGMAMF